MQKSPLPGGAGFLNFALYKVLPSATDRDANKKHKKNHDKQGGDGDHVVVPFLTGWRKYRGSKNWSQGFSKKKIILCFLFSFLMNYNVGYVRNRSTNQHRKLDFIGNSTPMLHYKILCQK